MKLHPSMIEALAVHEGFRKLGFQSDYIFVRPQVLSDDKILVHVAIITPENEFNVAVGVFDGTGEELKNQWEEATHWWNNIATDDEMNNIWLASKMRAQAKDIAFQLCKRGIKIPDKVEVN